MSDGYSRVLPVVEAGTYKRILIPVTDGQDVEEDGDNAASSSSSQGENGSENSSSCAKEESPTELAYTRNPCPPTAVVQQWVTNQDAQAWSKDLGIRGGSMSKKSSDTVSISSKRSSSASGRKRQPRESLLLALFAPGHKPSQGASVRPHHARASGRDVKKTRSSSDLTENHDQRTRSKSEATPKSSPTPKSRSESKPAPAPAPKSILKPSSSSSPSKNDKKSGNDLVNSRSSHGGFSALFRPPPRTAKSSPIVKKITCVSCLSDDVLATRAAHLKCGHDMCRSCLKRIFELSITDPQLMPPKCCTDDAISLNHVDHLFDKKFKILWNNKSAEYTTKNRMYCPRKDCSTWIKPKNIVLDKSVGRRMGTCSKCKMKVCKKCNLQWHGKQDCHNDAETKRVIDMAEELDGWQRCYRCKAVVQLSDGCNHMTCRCGAQFCMLCARPWRAPECVVECPLFSIPDGIDMEGDDWPNPFLYQLRQFQIRQLPPEGPPEGIVPLLNFRDRRDDPLDPLNPFDFRSQRRRRRPGPRRANTDGDLGQRQFQDQIDEELARALQELELERGDGEESQDDQARRDAGSPSRRPSRRARRPNVE